MKAIVIYYSYEGHAALAAKLVQEELKKTCGADGTADIARIETVDAKKRAGLAKYAWGGSQVVMHKRPEIKPLDVQLDDYDLVIFGAPVWAAHPAPPLLSYLDSLDSLANKKLAGKKASFFLCHAGGPGKAAALLKTTLENCGCTVEDGVDFVNPTMAQEAEIREKVKAWVEDVCPAF
jgi:flavodoxin